VFEFPEVHPDATPHGTFQRTLRVPDDGCDHSLPPGLGHFPLRVVDDLPQRHMPASWRRRGGVVLPMWQAEACWLSFSSPAGYPFSLKVAAGMVNAVNGKPWADVLDATDQDYVEVPGQSCLDDFCVAEDAVRQFVAMPLGQGYTAEGQVTGAAEHGGLQLLACPLRREVWERRETRPADAMYGVLYEAAAPMAEAMGLAPGGRIRQQINTTEERVEDWDPVARSRCFIHIANSLTWRAATGALPPVPPPTAADYTRAGLSSVKALGAQRGEALLPEEERFELPEPVVLRPRRRRRKRSDF
jgi:hypothetical protein